VSSLRFEVETAIAEADGGNAVVEGAVAGWAGIMSFAEKQVAVQHKSAAGPSMRLNTTSAFRSGPNSMVERPEIFVWNAHLPDGNHPGGPCRGVRPEPQAGPRVGSMVLLVARAAWPSFACPRPNRHCSCPSRPSSGPASRSSLAMRSGGRRIGRQLCGGHGRLRVGTD
jgi:hypothetical protein